jgi:hypothetical protein
MEPSPKSRKISCFFLLCFFVFSMCFFGFL